MTVMGEYDTTESTVLVRRARAGDSTAYTSLYQRFFPTVRQAASAMVRDRHEADDLAQEAFYMVFRAMKAGRGPDDSFAGYVLSTVRRLAFRHTTVQGRVWVTDDLGEQEGRLSTGAPDSPTLDDIASAWASLPPRWQEILWLIEVDRYSPAELASRLDMSPTAVSSLATRAREGLRTAFLAQQVTGDDRQCADIAPQLVALARGRLAVRRRRPLHRHLEACQTCRSRLHHLVERSAGLSLA